MTITQIDAGKAHQKSWEIDLLDLPTEEEESYFERVLDDGCGLRIHDEYVCDLSKCAPKFSMPPPKDAA